MRQRDRPSAAAQRPAHDLWERIERLDGDCHLAVHSLYLDRAGVPVLHWEVTIRPRGHWATGSPVCTRRRSLRAALTAALDAYAALPCATG